MTDPGQQVRERWYTRVMNLYRYSNIFLPGFNLLTRNLLKIRAERDYRRVQHSGKQHQQDIQSWLSAQQIFFGHAVPRSGTTFIANLLNCGARQASVMHEANINDYWYYTKAIHSPDEAYAYIKEYRLQEIYFRLQGESFTTYGEINPFLRRHCAAISLALPAVRQFHIVRDPHDVIRSLMSRELLGRKDPMAKRVRPPVEDPYADRWESMKRFEKLCWLWAADKRYIRTHVGQNVRFENLLSDFDYFSSKVLDFTGLTMDQRDWSASVKGINNATPHYNFPAYNDWGGDEKRSFETICGEEMAVYGY